METTKKIEQLKRGDLFRLKDKGNVFAYNGFCVVNKMYEYYTPSTFEFLYVRKGATVFAI